MIASVVLAIAVIAISATLSASYKQNSIRGNTTTAVALAQQLMEEISAKPIALPAGQTNSPGWSQGQTDRSSYDTVEDYNGYSDLSSSVAADGATFDLGDGGSYTRSVTVQTNAIPATLTGTAADFMLVTVTVTMPHGEKTSVSQLFTRTTILRYRHDS